MVRAPRRCRPEPTPRCVSGVSPGRSQYQEQRIACAPAATRPRREAHARQEPSGGVVADPPRNSRRVLAAAFLGGRVGTGRDGRAGRLALGQARLAAARRRREVLEAYHRPPLDRPRELAALHRHASCDGVRRPPRVLREPIFHPEMAPAPLAGAADRHRRRAGASGSSSTPGSSRGSPTSSGLERARRRAPAQLPLRCTCRARHGPPRVIERPKLRLKEIQRWILRELLDLDPAARRRARVRPRPLGPHPRGAARRPARGRARSTSRTSSRPSTAARVYGIFRTAGYPEAVAHTLTGLCTNVVPVEESVAGEFRLSRRLATPHLPQGAPTSPALANLAAFRWTRGSPGSPPRSAPATRATPTT